MKRLFSIILHYGVTGEQTPHEQRMVRTTNLLNLIAVAFTLLSFVNYASLKDNFSFFPVLTIFLLAFTSLTLSRAGHTRTAFLLFTLYVNLSVFYFSKRHPFETQNYLFYFPIIVSVVLLNNPSFSDRFSLVHAAICLAFFVASFTVHIPGFTLQLTPTQVNFLRQFNIISAVAITAILSFLIAKLIVRQNSEIVQQNTNLLKAREVVNASLREKEILLAELHHRVKNNLAIISGLLNLQGDATTNEEAKDIIGDSKSRIMSMALVHKMLYENTELKSLDLPKYVSELVNELFNTYHLAPRVKVIEDFDAVALPVSKLIPLGLIINEAVTNSIKYVFRSRRQNDGIFHLGIHNSGTTVTLSMRDDGPGFPPEFDSGAENVSLGIYLIKTLTEQLEGSVRFANQGGACIELQFPLH